MIFSMFGYIMKLNRCNSNLDKKYNVLMEHSKKLDALNVEEIK
jgi:hypothetical protein